MDIPSRFRFIQIVPVERPLVFIAIAFICGLAVGERFRGTPFWMLAGVACWAWAGSCILLRRPLIASIALLLGHFAAGAGLASIAHARADNSQLRHIASELADQPVQLTGELVSAPELAPDRIYLDFRVTRIRREGSDKAVSGMARLVIPFPDEKGRREYDALALEPGSRIRAWVHLKARQGYRNPGAPDFDGLLELKGYDAVGTVKRPLLIERLEGERSILLLRALFDFRARMMSIILRAFGQPAAGILAAGLFGNPHFLSKDAADAFRASGTYHLLVISGSHIALLGMLAMLVVRPLISLRQLRFICVGILLWAYGLMVGAEPAVTRSVVMATIALGAMSLWRFSGGVNALAASALALLAWSPRDLFNPGFQLSFMTVLAITSGAAPLHDRLRRIGEWRPRAATPYPPQAGRVVRWISEVLFWKEREFRAELARSSVKFRIEKADLSIRLASTRFGSTIQRVLRWCLAGVLVTGCVQACLLPFEVAYFHRISLVAIAANLMVEGLVTVLLLCGALFLIAYSVTAHMGSVASIIDGLGRVVLEATRLSVSWSGSNFRVPDYGAWSGPIFLLYFAPVVVLIVVLDRWNPLGPPLHRGLTERSLVTGRVPSSAAIVLAVMVLVLVWHPIPHSFVRGRLSLTFLDVGQGDAIAISFPRGATMLVDSGGRTLTTNRESPAGFVEDRIGTGEAAVAPFLWFQGIKRIDLIAATHGHADHTDGFNEIVPAFRVGVALTGVVPRADAEFDVFARTVRTNGIDLRALVRGDAFSLDDVRVDVLAPFPEARIPVHSGNNDSLVLRLSYGTRVFLLTGDIERPIEERLVRSNSDLLADVLKVAHHGSRTSSTETFLENVRPAYAVISVASPSPFGHPHPEVLKRLTESGAHVLQTSQCGAVTVSTDGSDLRVETFVKCGQ